MSLFAAVQRSVHQYADGRLAADVDLGIEASAAEKNGRRHRPTGLSGRQKISRQAQALLEQRPVGCIEFPPWHSRRRYGTICGVKDEGKVVTVKRIMEWKPRKSRSQSRRTDTEVDVCVSTRGGYVSRFTSVQQDKTPLIHPIR